MLLIRIDVDGLSRLNLWVVMSDDLDLGVNLVQEAVGFCKEIHVLVLLAGRCVET